jgi:hypothetical protein
MKFWNRIDTNLQLILLTSLVAIGLTSIAVFLTGTYIVGTTTDKVKVYNPTIHSYGSNSNKVYYTKYRERKLYLDKDFNSIFQSSNCLTLDLHVQELRQGFLNPNTYLNYKVIGATTCDFEPSAKSQISQTD